MVTPPAFHGRDPGSILSEAIFFCFENVHPSTLKLFSGNTWYNLNQSEGMSFLLGNYVPSTDVLVVYNDAFKTLL